MQFVLVLLTAVVAALAAPAVSGPSEPLSSCTAWSSDGHCADGNKRNTQLSRTTTTGSLAERGGRHRATHDLNWRRVGQQNSTGAAKGPKEKDAGSGRTQRRRQRPGSMSERRLDRMRRKHRRRQRVHDAAGSLMASPRTGDARRRRPCPEGLVRARPRGRCVDPRFSAVIAARRGGQRLQPQWTARDRLPQHVSETRPISENSEDTSRASSRHCPGGRCSQRSDPGARPAEEADTDTAEETRRPQAAPLFDERGECADGRQAWENGRCVPLATLRSCPTDSYRLGSGLCVRCWVTDRVDEKCPPRCATDQAQNKCVCCQPNGDDP